MDVTDFKCNKCDKPLKRRPPLQPGPILCPLHRWFREEPSDALCTKLDPTTVSVESVWRRVGHGYRAVLESRPAEYGPPLEARTDPQETFTSLKVTGTLKAWRPARQIETEPDALTWTLADIPDESTVAAKDRRWQKKYGITVTGRISGNLEPATIRTDSESKRRPMRKYSKPYPGKRMAASDYRKAVARRTWFENGIFVSAHEGEGGHEYDSGCLADYLTRVAESRKELGGQPLPAMPPLASRQPDFIPPPVEGKWLCTTPVVIRPPDHPGSVWIPERGRCDTGGIIDLTEDLKRDNAPWLFRSYWADLPWAKMSRSHGDERDLEDHGWASPSAHRRSTAVHNDRGAFLRMLRYTGLADREIDALPGCRRFLERYIASMRHALGGQPEPQLTAFFSLGMARGRADKAGVRSAGGKDRTDLYRWYALDRAEEGLLWLEIRRQEMEAETTRPVTALPYLHQLIAECMNK